MGYHTLKIDNNYMILLKYICYVNKRILCTCIKSGVEAEPRRTAKNTVMTARERLDRTHQKVIADKLPVTAQD